MNNHESNTLLFLLGDAGYSLDAFFEVVTWCPIRHQLLKRRGVRNHLFGDFSPGAERGKVLDIELHNRLEDCLQEEAGANPSMKWAPLAFQQIQWPLLRYLWLKECARGVFRAFPPKRCVISSDKDQDFVRAIQAVAAEFEVELEVRAGAFDGSSSTLYHEAPYGIPVHLDPAWFFKLHWQLIKTRRKRIDILIESYPNIRHASMPPLSYLFNLDRALAFMRLAWKKLLRLLRITPQGLVVEFDLPVVKRRIATCGRSLIWQQFSKDEQAIINRAIYGFFNHYTPEFLNKVAERIAYVLSITKAVRVVLSVDLLDADRLLAHIARKQGIPVDYLPHGNIYEDCSGVYRKRSFDADRILAWSDNSRRAFVRFGWNARTIEHPVNKRAIVPLKRLPKDCQLWRVLSMIPEWLYVSQGGREDCAINDLIKIYGGLTKMGVLGSRIHVKYHETAGIKEVREAKDIHLKRLQRLLDMRFRVLNSTLTVSGVMAQYDLVIIGPTTGIYEAVLRGIPVVLFGDGFDRIGALEGYSLPRAHTGKEIQNAVNVYFTDDMERVYTRLAQSLQAGPPLSSL